MKLIINNHADPRILEKLNQLEKLIMKSETEVKAAIEAAVDKATNDIAAGIAKEKQEVLDAIAAVPPAGISDQGLADLLSKISGIGTTTLAGVDAIITPTP